jgi:xylose dehydrogenase (NAD/NADP)
MVKPRVRWGVLGTARINERMIPCIERSPRSELVAVASRKQGTADAFAARWKIPTAYGDYESLLRDPNIDVAYISLPNHLHAEWAIRMADAGKHVLCEKPLALTTVQVKQMTEAAQRNNVVIQEAAMMRFHPQIEFVRDLIAEGTIGEIRLARGLFTFLLERENDIRWEPEMGGGSLWDLGSYCVRWFRTIFSDEPHQVLATHVTTRRGVDTSFSGELYFANGVTAQFFTSFAAFAQTEADVIGSSGRVYLDMPWSNLLDRPSHVNWVHVVGERVVGTFGDSVENIKEGAHTFENVNAYQDQVESMAGSILDGSPPKISLADSYNNTAVITALYVSARLNRPVAVQSI